MLKELKKILSDQVRRRLRKELAGGGAQTSPSTYTFYHGTDLLSALSMVKEGKIFCSDIEYTTEEGITSVGFFATKTVGDAYEWALQLLYERGIDDVPPAVVKIVVPAEDILEIAPDPVALYHLTDSRYIVLKPDKVGDDDSYSPLSISLVYPTNWNEVIEGFRDLWATHERGGWAEELTWFSFENEEDIYEEEEKETEEQRLQRLLFCLLYTSPSPRD